MTEATPGDGNGPSEQELWDSYNSLLLSSDLGRVRKMLVRYDLFRRSLKVPGDVVECGVFKGTGLMYWLKLLEIYSPGSSKGVVGLDTFTEFGGELRKEEQVSAGEYVSEASFEGVEPEALMSVAWAMGAGDRVELVAGDIAETAARYVEENPGFRISLLHLDLDTYEGTKAALEAFYPVVSRAGVIVMDEYGARGWGESDAVDEFFSSRGVELKVVPNAYSPSTFAIKP